MADKALTQEQIGKAFYDFFNSTGKINLVDDSPGGELKFPKSAIKAKQAFKDFMMRHNVTNPLQGLSLSISFGGQALYDWMTKIITGEPKPTEFRFFFGIYTDDFIEEDNFNEENLDRLTIIISPYTKDAEKRDIPLKKIKLRSGEMADVKPYDLGGLHP